MLILVNVNKLSVFVLTLLGAIGAVTSSTGKKVDDFLIKNHLGFLTISKEYFIIGAIFGAIALLSAFVLHYFDIKS